MSNLAVTNTFVSGAIILASEHNTNFSDIVTYVNARNNGGTAWDALTVTGASVLSSTLSVAGAITATGGIANLFSYRRPNLVYVSATTIDVENNTATANQTSIVFPDGTIRSVTEDTASTHKYRRFLITATAEFTTGTEDSGLYSGLSETTNTWYAVYAVKSLIDTTKFVLVGTTTLPIRANAATLNSNLGTNGWVYLGMIRNGDNNIATGDIVEFTQTSNFTSFANIGSGSPGGVTLASNSGTTSALEYTVTRGTGASNIPNNIALASFSGYATASASVTFTLGSGGVGPVIVNALSASGVLQYKAPIAFIPAAVYFQNGGSSAARQITLGSYIDNTLGPINPLL